MSTQIISQSVIPSNGNTPSDADLMTAVFADAFIPKPDNRITVTLTRPARTTVMGFILDAGTGGQVVDYRRTRKGGVYLIDFGLQSVISLPANSPLLKVTNGG